MNNESKHPEPAECAQGEREAFEAYRDRRNALLESEGHKPGSKWHVTQAHYPTWEAARAAMAQPSPAPKSDMQRAIESWEELSLGAHLYRCCVGVWNNLLPDEEGMPEYRELRKAMDDWENGQPSPAPELERPEVVAFLMKPDTYEPYVGLRRDGTCDCVEPLMAVAQHDRIAGALSSKLDALLQAVQYKTGIWADDESFANVIKEISQIRQAMADARGEVQNLKSALWEVQEERGTAVAGKIPDGWNLVPATLTREMKEAMIEPDGRDSDGYIYPFTVERQWSAVLESAPSAPVAQAGQAKKWTYASEQETNCAGCGVRKHTPLRVDWMGGYVCLTCIDEKLEELYEALPDAQAGQVPEGYALVPLRETEAMHDAMMSLLYKGIGRQETQKLLDAYIAAALAQGGD